MTAWVIRANLAGTPNSATSNRPQLEGVIIDVFGKGTEEGTRPLLPPGTCWICDQSPQQEEIRVIDTRRNTRAGGALSHESVRKYICESCAVEMGSAMGLVDAARFETASRVAANQSRVVNELTAELQAERERKVRVVVADEIADVVSETIRTELAKQVKRPTARKPASAE